MDVSVLADQKEFFYISSIDMDFIPYHQSYLPNLSARAGYDTR